MLYNRQWDRKPDPHSLQDMIAWLGTKNPSERYDFNDASRCLIGQWLKHCDGHSTTAKGMSASHYIVNGKVQDFRKLYLVANSGDNPHTFGGALRNARALMSKDVLERMARERSYA